MLWAQGWVHSRERSAEMQFARALFRAELSQTAKSTLAHNELDAFVRGWGFDDALDQEVEQLSPVRREQAEAFAQGFEAQQQTRPRWPWMRPELSQRPWAASDSVLLARTWGILSWWESRADLVFFLMEQVQAGLSWDRLCDLVPDLGPEPDREGWASAVRPVPLSPEATVVLNRLRRWRPGITVVGSEEPRVQWGVSVVTDVTETGLPFLEMELRTPGTTLRGLSLPGLPGLVTGRSAGLAWHFAPSWGDCVDFRLQTDGKIGTFWAGRGRFGTLAALLEPLGTSSLVQLVDVASSGGAACLTLTAATPLESGEWELGPRWQRQHPRDAWLPSPVGSPLPALTIGGATTAHHPVRKWLETQLALPARTGWPPLQDLLASDYPLHSATVLPQLRFLLPETEEVALLRTWSGQPTAGREAWLLQRLTNAVVRAFWKTAGLQPDLESPAVRLLWPAIDQLLTSPNSSWLPSGQKNRLLREAVNAELALSDQQPPAFCDRPYSPRFLYHETLGGRRRTFASVVLITCDFSEPTLSVFQTDDETQAPVYSNW